MTATWYEMVILFAVYEEIKRKVRRKLGIIIDFAALDILKVNVLKLKGSL